MNIKEMKDHIEVLGDRIEKLTNMVNQRDSELSSVKADSYDTIVELQKREKNTHQSAMSFYNALADMLGVTPENNTLNLDQLLAEVEKLKSDK